MTDCSEGEPRGNDLHTMLDCGQGEWSLDQMSRQASWQGTGVMLVLSGI